MNVLAIYAVNQHIEDLYFAAEQERIARALPRKPSAIRRAFAAVKVLDRQPLVGLRVRHRSRRLLTLDPALGSIPSGCFHRAPRPGAPPTRHPPDAAGVLASRAGSRAPRPRPRAARISARSNVASSPSTSIASQR